MSISSISVHDVAAYIVSKRGPMSAMKLQKLVYYSQAWALVWDEKPLFRARMEAWANGPVCRTLYAAHRGQFEIKDWPSGDPGKIRGKQQETVDAVLKFYGDKSAHWLSELTHRERPWKDARNGLSLQDVCSEEITHAAMAEYYSSISF
jgi:uncharacterized phage-associated protein